MSRVPADPLVHTLTQNEGPLSAPEDVETKSEHSSPKGELNSEQPQNLTQDTGVARIEALCESHRSVEEI